MRFLKIFIITLFVTFSSLANITYAETLKFGSSTYESEVKKGKAYGVGTITFSDGSKYEGKVKKNRIHGKGKYTDSINLMNHKKKYDLIYKRLDANNNCLENEHKFVAVVSLAPLSI